MTAVRFVVAAAALSTALSAAGQTIKLGELNSYKVFPAFLEPYKKGMELAQEEVNAAGGVLGRKIEVVAADHLNITVRFGDNTLETTAKRP